MRKHILFGSPYFKKLDPNRAKGSWGRKSNLFFRNHAYWVSVYCPSSSRLFHKSTAIEKQARRSKKEKNSAHSLFDSALAVSPQFEPLTHVQFFHSLMNSCGITAYFVIRRGYWCHTLPLSMGVYLRTSGRGGMTHSQVSISVCGVCACARARW